MKKLATGLLTSLSVIALTASSASAEVGQVVTQQTFNLTQTVEEPPLRLYIRQPDGSPDNNYAVNFDLRTSSLECLGIGSGAPAGVIGTDEEPIFMSIPTSIENWSLGLRTTNTWTGQNPKHTISINDKTDNGCRRNPLNGPNDTRPGGLLTVEPEAIKITSNCTYDCDNNPINPSPALDFASSDGDTIPITYSTTPNAGWQGTISGIRLVQTLPANLPPDNYTLPMLICLLAL